MESPSARAHSCHTAQHVLHERPHAAHPREDHARRALNAIGARNRLSAARSLLILSGSAISESVHRDSGPLPVVHWHRSPSARPSPQPGLALAGASHRVPGAASCTEPLAALSPARHLRSSAPGPGAAAGPRRESRSKHPAPKGAPLGAHEQARPAAPGANGSDRGCVVELRGFTILLLGVGRTRWLSMLLPPSGNSGLEG